MAKDQASKIGRRIRRYREDRDLSLSGLADEAKVSKGYLWSLENDPSAAHPSADTLYRIAESLGVTITDLLGRKLHAKPPEEIPGSLQEFAKERNLPETDVRMLATIRFRGEQPRSKERWEYIYNAIRTSQVMDEDRRSKARRGRR